MKKEPKTFACGTRHAGQGVGSHWLNGSVSTCAHIDPSDRGFLLGDGLFETLRATCGEPWHLARHLARLRAGAHLLGIPLAWSDAEIAGGARAVSAGLPDAAIRITLTRGPGPRGVLPPSVQMPTLLITAAPLPSPPTSPPLPPLRGPPCRAILATATRRNEHSPLSRIKSLNYLDSIIARQEAAHAGADEAILCNTAGRVAEATAGNLFMRTPDGWLTPPIADGALPGIARALILEAGLAMEKSIMPADLCIASAAFVSSSLALRPLTQIDAHVLAPADLAGFEVAVRG